MDYLAIIISIIALVGAGFAFLRASSSHRILLKRIETLKEKNNAQEARLRKLEGNAGRGNRQASDLSEPSRRNQLNPEQQQESRQKQQPRQEQRQKQRDRQQQPQQDSPSDPETQGVPHQPQPRKKKENRRRNEPMDRANALEQGEDRPVRAAKSIKLEIAEGDFLDSLEQSAGNAPAAAAEPGIRYAIIPEDGVIRMHQLQQQPDSDSYLEVDVPADGSHVTNYRFNLAGNHAFVIAQGIDRLENAFSFEKPANRMVSTVVQQQDGVLARVNNGWKIQEKARIDFR